MAEELNSLGKDLKDMDNKAKYDTAAKQLLSNKPFLAYILKYTVKEYANLTLEEIETYIENDPEVGTVPVLGSSHGDRIVGMNTESNKFDEKTLRYDIRFNAKIPGKPEAAEFYLMINIELQNDNNPGYDLVPRGFVYCGRMLSEQLDRNVPKDQQTGRYMYQHLQKVYSIWIVCNCSKELGNTVSLYAPKHIPMYGQFEDSARSDLINVVMVRLPNIQVKDKTFNKPTVLHEVLTTIFVEELSAEERLRRLKENYHIRVTNQIREEVNDMCNLSKGIEERGFERGDKHGFERGDKHGFERGDKHGIESAAKRMIQKGLLTDEEIAEYTGLDITRIAELREELKVSNK